MIVSAHEVCRTRLCRAENCENDQEPYSRLCWQCAKKDRNQIRIHQTPPPREAILWCSVCRTDKPDAEFALRPSTGKESGGRPGGRRGRYYACLACEAQARRDERVKRAKRKRPT